MKNEGRAFIKKIKYISKKYFYGVGIEGRLKLLDVM